MANEINRNLGNISVGTVTASGSVTATGVTYSPAKTIIHFMPAWAAVSPTVSGSNWGTFVTGSGTGLGAGGALTTRIGLQSAAAAATLICQIPSPPNGATLTSVQMTYRLTNTNLVGGTRTPASARLGLNLARQPIAATTTAVSLFSAFQQVGTYGPIDGTTVTSATFNTTQNNVIDLSTYYYYVIVQEEFGTGAVSGAGNTVIGFTFTYTTSSST